MINNLFMYDPNGFLPHTEESYTYSSSTDHRFPLAAPLDLSSKSYSSIEHGFENSIRKQSIKLQLQEDPSRKRYRRTTHQIKFEEYKSSPISGIVIIDRSPTDIWRVQNTDIDPIYNVVQVTDEAKAKLAKIVNVLGEYRCQLCRNLFEDAFLLAQHQCVCIMNISYKCWQCEKVFSCPANLASHMRWHKPAPASFGYKYKDGI